MSASSTLTVDSYVAIDDHKTASIDKYLATAIAGIALAAPASPGCRVKCISVCDSAFVPMLGITTTASVPTPASTGAEFVVSTRS